MISMTCHETDRRVRARLWLRRVGRLGFAFFLVKGIAWMILPLAIWLSA
jgi:hypothetical protein